MDKKFYGLILSKKTKKLEQKPKSIFDSSDEESEGPPIRKTNVSSLSTKSLAKNLTLQKKLEKDDPTIYEYDSSYDSMKQNKTEKQKSVKKEGPKYIANLLKAADKRKKEQERRQERKIQTEREKEGDEFRDKEAFVTSAYKKKMIEMQEEEDREQLQDQIDEMMDVKKQNDLSGFYRHYLKQTVGEEKIPEFGERESKIKELSKRIKRENSSIPDEDKTQDHRPIENFENLDADSYSSSSSDNESNNKKEYKQKSLKKDSHSTSSSSEEEEKHGDSNKDGLKYRNISKKKSKSKSSDSSENEINEKMIEKHLKSVGKKSVSESSESDISEKRMNSSKRKVSKSQDQSPKRLKQDMSTSLDHSRDSQSGVTLQDEDSVSQLHGETSGTELASKQTKPKIDIRLIFVKRTVGELFDQAQKRYFQRIADQKHN